MFLNESRYEKSVQQENTTYPTTTVTLNTENVSGPSNKPLSKLAIGGIAALVLLVLIAVLVAVLIILKRRKQKSKQNEEPEKTSERESEVWSALPQSLYSKRTINHVRRIADAVNVATNPDKPVIRLCLGDPTVTGQLPPSRVALDALEKSKQSHKHDGYAPSVGELAARQAVVDRYSLPEAIFTAEDVILASGCAHALEMTIETIADSGDNILIPKPGFPLYSTLCRPHNIEDRAYNLSMDNGGIIDLNHLESLIDRNTKAIIVNNPGNPTGVVYPKEHLESILELAEKYKLTIIADEIYGELVYDGAVFHPMASLSPKVPIVCCDGIAKRWNVPGWRLGWLIVHNRHGVLTEVKTGIVALSQKIVGPCSLVQGALPTILKETPKEYFEWSRTVMSSNANIIFNILKDVRGLKPLKPYGAMYFMVGIDNALYGDDMTFVQKLTQEESLIVMPGTAFSAPGWIRLVLVHSNEIMTEAAHRICRLCERLVADAATDDGTNNSDAYSTL